MEVMKIKKLIDRKTIQTKDNLKVLMGYLVLLTNIKFFLGVFAFCGMHFSFPWCLVSGV